MDNLEAKYLNKIVREIKTGKELQVAKFGQEFVLVIPNKDFEDNVGYKTNFEDLENNFIIVS